MSERPHFRRWCDPDPTSIRTWRVYRLLPCGRRGTDCLLVAVTTEASLVELLEALLAWPWGYCWDGST